MAGDGLPFQKSIQSFVHCTAGKIVSWQLAAASFWNGLFGVKEISLQRDIKSAKPKDHLWIFGQKRQKLQRIIYIHIACYLLVFCSLHLQSPSPKTCLLAPPSQAFSRVVCDEPAGPVSSGTPRLFTSFLKYFTSYLGLRFIYIYCPKLLLAWFGLALDRCSIAPRMKTKP